MDYSKPETISLDDLRKRIKSTDLVPSRAVLLEEIDTVFEKLTRQGINTWLDLQKAIKNPKKIEDFAKKSGIDFQYLMLLRREIEGYHPKPFNLNVIDWVPQVVITKLLDDGITASDQLHVEYGDLQSRILFAEKTGINREMLDYLANLASLCRVQWVSPTAARMLIEAGYENCQKLASANADELFTAMDRVNENGKYFKGTIGLRDIKRLIEAAKYCL
jgi:rhodanese-related sulfurtransferase